MWKKALLLILGMFVFGIVFIQPTLGKEYPTKPIEIIAPWSAGSGADLLTRIIADTAKKYLGQPMIVVNKPGAGGSMGAADIIKSTPDGYKLVLLPSGYFASTVNTQKVPFDPNDLIPIANFVKYKDVLIVKADSPWKTLGDLLDYARKNPGKLKWGHTGRGITIHISTLLIFRKAGVETIDIPYPGGPEIISAILGGHIDAGVGGYGSYKAQSDAGTVRYLFTYSDERYDDPRAPTIVEFGFPEAAMLPTLMSVYAHKNTPDEIKKILFAAFRKVFDDPEFKKAAEKLGMQPKFGGPELVTETIKKSEEYVVPVLKELGIYVWK
jgi:tripartite-type tricarboxylate transporter receptor subunit TctC